MTSHKRQADRSQVGVNAECESGRQRYEAVLTLVCDRQFQFKLQAFNDIFGRPTGAARPAYSHQQGVRPAPVGNGALPTARPQSYYAGQQYPAGHHQQQHQAYPGAPQPYQHSYSYAGNSSSSNSRPAGNAYGHEQHTGLPPPGGSSYAQYGAAGHNLPPQAINAHGQPTMPNYQATTGPGGLPSIPQGAVSESTTYTPVSYLAGPPVNAQMPSPPPPPSGPVFRQLTDPMPVNMHPGVRAPLTNDSTISSYASSQQSGHAPRLPSFDMNTGEYNWFGRKSGENTQTSTPSATSEDISPGVASMTISEPDQYADSERYYSQNPSAGPSTANSSRRSYTAATMSSSASIYGQDLEASETRQSPASGMSVNTANSGPFADFQQHYPGMSRILQSRIRADAGLLASYGQNVGQPHHDSRTSMDSDQTSYYVNSVSTDATGGRFGYPSGPSSQTTHNFQQYPQGAAGPYARSGFPLQGMSPYSQSIPLQGSAALRHSSSRKSAESVRVMPTQPKASSVYGDRSFSFSGNIERPDMRPPSHSPRPTSSISEMPYPPHPTSSSGHGGSGSMHPAAMTRPQRAPIVYPALLSRVAEAFKMRISVAERTKDGLSYKDAFDGREAVDKIAYIIRTTDRNLALLLGRALDAQKFFHDVTYDHRLRDSPHELYQFRERLHASPFGSIAGDGHYPGQHLLDGSPGPQHINSWPSSIAPPRPASPTDTMLSEDSAQPSGVFTLLTDCYSPTCTRDKLCYSIACPRRLEQQARLNLKPKPGLKKSNSEEGLLGDDDRLGSVSRSPL